MWPLVALGDFQGGPNRFHSAEDRRLNHFTGCAGQTIYRGDRLPKELYGNAFLPEPVGRLIRRATVKVEDGITKLDNPYPESEFIRSSETCMATIPPSISPMIRMHARPRSRRSMTR